MSLRTSFPVLETRAYLNAGTDGPLPIQAVAAAAAELERALAGGRTFEHFQRRHELNDQLRTAYAALLGCPASDLALTTCTSEGVSLVVSGLDLSRGDEIVTSDEEHPGLLGALQVATELHGVNVRVAPLQELAGAIGPRTRLVACSHVGWMSGAVVPAELAAVAREVPVLLDGAQGVGAVPVDVQALGCAAYAGSGQKWLCGPDGLGMLYVSPLLRERLAVGRRGYANLENPDAGLEAKLHEDARRLDTFSLSAESVALALGSLRLFGEFGWARVHRRARELAATLVGMLEAGGREVSARGETTLVTFSSRDPETEREQLAERGVLVRNIPGRPLLRASVGVWNDEGDLERLIAGLGGG
jgi:L-cysteine/cystine lyase